MSMIGYEGTREHLRDACKPLIAEARQKRLWLFTSYQNLWFTLDELERDQAEGRFIWGPPNWRLRDPAERLAELAKAKTEAIAAYDRCAAKIGGTS